MRNVLAALVAGGALLAGCATPAESFQNHVNVPEAAYDMHCPQEQLVVGQLDAEKVSVTGCGKRAIYAHNPIGNGWLRVGEIENITAQPPASP